MMKSILGFLTEQILLADGAMGTMLYKQGVPLTQCFDELNLTRPAAVAEVHRAYIEAGAQLIETNTFGANRYRLAQHDALDQKVVEINTAGVELARRVVEASFKEVFVGGCVGPLGVRLAPYGRVQAQQAFNAFREQIAALITAGVDVVIVETMSDLNEMSQAIRAARDLSAEIPVLASMTFTRDDLTLLGDNPKMAAGTLAGLGANIIGINCSGGPAQALRILGRMREGAPQARFSVMPNAGWPAQSNGRIHYPATPDYFGEYALAFADTGANVVGGCCGTTPEHIAAMRAALDAPPVERPVQLQLIAAAEREERIAPADQPTQLAQQLAAGKFVTTVEMSPPKGVSTHKLLAAVRLLEEAGVDAIDVADYPRAQMRMSAWAVCRLIHKEVGLESVLHFPTRGRNLLRVQGDLLAAHALGVRNIFMVMGDPTAIGDYPDAMDDYDLVPSGLIKLAKQGFNLGMDHAGTELDQPTSFFVGCALNLCPPKLEREIKVLKRKLNNGADFALTQPVYDPAAAREFLRQYQETHGEPDLHILVGVLPLMTERHADFLHNEVPGVSIPDHIRERMRKAGDNGRKEGLKISLELLEELREIPQIHGAYLMPPFGHFEIAAEIIESIR